MGGFDSGCPSHFRMRQQREVRGERPTGRRAVEFFEQVRLPFFVGGWLRKSEIAVMTNSSSDTLSQANKMKKAGYILLVLGFLWIGYDVTMDFTRSQYMTWIVYVKTKLPEGDSISRQKASSLMKEMGLELRDRHQGTSKNGMF